MVIQRRRDEFVESIAESISRDKDVTQGLRGKRRPFFWERQPQQPQPLPGEDLFPPQLDLPRPPAFPASASVTQAERRFEMPTGELKPAIMVYFKEFEGGGQTTIPAERVTMERSRELEAQGFRRIPSTEVPAVERDEVPLSRLPFMEPKKPVPTAKLPPAKEGVGFVLDIITGRRTTENPEGLNPVRYAQQFPGSELAIALIPLIATAGVAIFQGGSALVRSRSIQNLANQLYKNFKGAPADITKRSGLSDIEAELLANQLARRLAENQKLYTIIKGTRRVKGARYPGIEKVVQEEATNLANSLVPRGTQTGALAFGGRPSPREFPLASVIRWKQGEIASTTNPLEKSFLNQELKDLVAVRRQGRTTIPEEYFRSAQTGELNIPPEVAGAVREVTPPLAGVVPAEPEVAPTPEVERIHRISETEAFLMKEAEKERFIKEVPIGKEFEFVDETTFKSIKAKIAGVTEDVEGETLIRVKPLVGKEFTVTPEYLREVLGQPRSKQIETLIERTEFSLRIAKGEGIFKDLASSSLATKFEAELQTLQELQARPTQPTPEVTPEVPITELGQPEAGLQPSMLSGEVTAREVRPVGRGVPTQISMEEQLRLQQQRQAAAVTEITRVAPEEVEAIKQELAGLEEFIRTDLLANERFNIGVRKVTKGGVSRTEANLQSLDQMINVKEQTFGESFSLKQAQAITGTKSSFSASRLKSGAIEGRAVLDELADKHTGGDVPALVQKVNQIRQAKQRISELRSESKTATRQVEAIQQQGKVAPESVPPEDAKMAHTEFTAPDGAKLPPPPTETGQPPVEPREPSDIMREIAEKSALGERPDQTLLRLHEGTINAETTRTNVLVKEGGKKLKESGIGVWKRAQLVPRPQDISKLDELYVALHNPSKVDSGEIKVPQGLEEVYRELRALTDWEQSARLDFDPDMATVADYFYRGWKPPEGAFADVQQGRPLVKTPSFKKTRVNAGWAEMREWGAEPLFWNPYQQWATSRVQGVKYREQMGLVSYLKGMGEEFIKPHDGGPVPQGWRVPEVGPAFEGKPFAIQDPVTGSPTVMFTRRWIVQDKIANSLENIYGKRPNLSKFVIKGKTVDPLSIIDALTFTPKRAKLFLSFFQQIDFLTRAGGNSWARGVDELLAGNPLEALKAPMRFPKAAMEILHANFSPSKRLSLAKQLDDTTPLVEGRPGVHFKGITEAGLSTFDPAMFPEDIDKLTHEVAVETGALKKIPKTIGALESAMRRGLFQGTYPAALITSIKNNIAPMTVRQHSLRNDAQINAEIARQANILFSTIPPSQSIIQNRFLRETLRRVFFSIGESEGLLRQAAGAVKGPNAAFWRRQWLGVYLFLITTASIMSYAFTREPLPAERYSPISKNNWGPLPFGYNTEFAAPTLPFKGRGGAELTLDLAGQMDTAFRILDPVNFITSRESVPVRATQNQISGTDFYGAPIDDVGPGGIISRISQLLNDLFAPIGLGPLGGELARKAGAEEIVPRGEERLGIAGLALQATGLNIRAETTRSLLDRFAQESGFLKADGTPVQSWNDLEPFQKKELSNNEALQTELGLRSEAAIERQQLKAAGFATLDDIDQERIVRGEALVTEFFSEFITDGIFRDEVTLLKREMSARKAQVDEDFQLFLETGKIEKDPNKRALTEYYNTFELAKRKSRVIDWDSQEALEKHFRKKWTDAQEAYVDRNIGLTEWGPLMAEYNQAIELLKPYWEVSKGVAQASKRRQMRVIQPEMDAALVKWYGYKPTQGLESRRFFWER